MLLLVLDQKTPMFVAEVVVVIELSLDVMILPLMAKIREMILNLYIFFLVLSNFRKF